MDERITASTRRTGAPGSAKAPDPADPTRACALGAETERGTQASPLAGPGATRADACETAGAPSRAAVGDPSLCEGCSSACGRFADAALRGEGLSVGYGERVVIEPMDVTVPDGKVTAVIGPNGCGKSTLLKALARTMPLRGGSVYLNGRAIAELPTVEVARQMALLPQSPQAPGGLTVGELVAYGRYPHQRGLGRLTREDRAIIAWALSLTHLEPLADRALDALSGGQRQRAWIAMALAQDTGLILLDEPTTYLDMAHQLEVLELLRDLNREQGKTIALVIHELNLAARFADWMIALRDGAIRAAGEPAEVMTEPVLREVFGLDALIEPDPWTGRPSLVSYRLAGERES